MNQSHTNELAATVAIKALEPTRRSSDLATRVSAIDLLALLVSAVAAAGIASLLAGWPVLDRLLLWSAISAGAAVPWLYSTMISGTRRGIQWRLAVFASVLLLSFSGIPEIVSAAFAVHAIAATQAASGHRQGTERSLLMAWSGAAAVCAVIGLLTVA